MDTIRAEFEKEAAAFVQIIRDMIAGGHLSEASQLLEQYKLINPTDRQIPDIKAAIEAAAQEAGGSAGADTERDGGGNVICNTAVRADLCPEFLRNIESIFIVTGLTMRRTGVFTSLYGKVKLLEERLGYNSLILICRHDINLRKTEVWLKTFAGNSSVLGSGTGIKSIYEHFQNTYAEGLENRAVYAGSRDNDGLRYEKASEKTYVVYDGDKRVRLDVYNGYSGSLRTQRFYENEVIVKDIVYDDMGYLNNVRAYTDGEDERKYSIKYYKTSGELCIEAFFDKKKDEFEPYKILVFDNDGNVRAELKSNHELAALYLSETANKDKLYMLIFESGTVAEIAGSLDKSLTNMLKVNIVHSIFLKNAYNTSSGPQLYYEYMCKNPDKFDGIVMLTTGARRDFTKLYGHHKSTFVIPHPYPFDIEPVDFEMRNKKKAVMIARLFGEKKLSDAIDIFTGVVRQVEDAVLEIYGTGPEKEKLEAQIKKRGMENNIFLMGYTDDAISIYRGAVLSMMTSIAEGYGLVLMESICNGCPAFSYDIKYGPSDIITEGKTGFLIPRDNKEKFTAIIVEYLKNEQLQRAMSLNCYEDAHRFSQENFLNRWLEMVKTLSQRGT